ncbi:MAG: TonB family protein [Arcobacter sp.]|uniref:energy transducer TonB n=1 Tax=Arcobacter sp. TaxID=1872629 RepID=UPI0025903F30|nr:energy transducer TonB [Arcobacter sp.]MDD3009570.1 TonB family protein [Arcobacter sp.]
MKIIILAFIISISLHLLFLKKYKNEELTKNTSNNELVEKKSDVKFVKIKKQEIVETKIEPVEKPVEVKKTEPVKNEIIKEKKQLVKNIEKNVERKKEVNFEKAKKLQDNLLKEQIVKNENSLQEKTLENFLSQKEPVNKEILTELEKLYGEEYQTFTKVQKAYLEKNLNNFQVITQRVLDRLGYPKLAAKLKIGGINIVEFMFHPDGSITDLKIINSSSYAVLDEYTLELIEIAYKDYPKPTTTTKLRFKVFYRLF